MAGISKQTQLGLRRLFRLAQFLFGLNAPVAADMQNADATFFQHLCDEQAAVADGGVFLATKQSEIAVSFDPSLQSFEPPLEEVGFGDFPIEDMTVGVVILIAIGTTAELFS